jgi:hypothetical protein
MPEEAIGRVQEVACDQEVLRFRVGNRIDAVAVQAVERGSGIGEDDRRMRRDEELRAAARCQIVDDAQER